MFFEKKTVILPKIASVTLHVPKDFWWHRIFGSATIFGVRKFWSTWSRGGVHGEVSWPIDYIIPSTILTTIPRMFSVNCSSLILLVDRIVTKRLILSCQFHHESNRIFMKKIYLNHILFSCFTV